MNQLHLVDFGYNPKEAALLKCHIELDKIGHTELSNNSFPYLPWDWEGLRVYYNELVEYQFEITTWLDIAERYFKEYPREYWSLADVEAEILEWSMELQENLLRADLQDTLTGSELHDTASYHNAVLCLEEVKALFNLGIRSILLGIASTIEKEF